VADRSGILLSLFPWLISLPFYCLYFRGCSVPPFCCRYFRSCSVLHFAVSISVTDRSAILLSLFPWLISLPFCRLYFRGCSVPPFCCRYFRSCSVRHFTVSISVAVRSAIFLSLFPWLISLPFWCLYFRGCSVPPFCCRYFRSCSVRHFAVSISVAVRSAILLSLFPWLFGSPFCCRYFCG